MSPAAAAVGMTCEGGSEGDWLPAFENDPMTDELCWAIVSAELFCISMRELVL